MGVTVFEGMIGVTLFGLFLPLSFRYVSKNFEARSKQRAPVAAGSSDLGVAELTRYARSAGRNDVRRTEPLGRIAGFTGETGNRATVIEPRARVFDELHPRAFSDVSRT